MDERKKKKLIWQVPFLILLIVGSVIIIRQQHSIPYQHDEGFIFGTIYHVTYQSDTDMKKEIEAEMQKVDDALSMFNKNSIISRINNNQPTTCNDMFVEVFKISENISKETNGAFDITVAPLVNAWGFGFKNRKMPNQQQVDSLRQLIGYQKIQLRGNQLIKADKRMMLDCSAVAKGYGSDVVARFLEKKGIKNFLVEIGGEIVNAGGGGAEAGEKRVARGSAHGLVAIRGVKTDTAAGESIEVWGLDDRCAVTAEEGLQIVDANEKNILVRCRGRSGCDGDYRNDT